MPASNDTQAIVLAKLQHVEKSTMLCCFNQYPSTLGKDSPQALNVALADGRNDHAEDNVPDLEEVDNEESAEDGSEDDDDGE